MKKSFCELSPADAVHILHFICPILYLFLLQSKKAAAHLWQSTKQQDLCANFDKWLRLAFTPSLHTSRTYALNLNAAMLHHTFLRFQKKSENSCSSKKKSKRRLTFQDQLADCHFYKHISDMQTTNQQAFKQMRKEDFFSFLHHESGYSFTQFGFSVWNHFWSLACRFSLLYGSVTFFVWREAWREGLRG